MKLAAAGPSMFKQLPRELALAQYLTRHDDGRGFITRLDRSTVADKRLTFAKALALNTAILLFVCGLAYVTVCQGLSEPLPLQPEYRMAVLMTQDAVVFAAIIVLMRSTTIPFVLGECRLRLKHGFRRTEIVIRRLPTALASSLPRTLHSKAGVEAQHMERSWRMAIHAINPRLLYSSAGALLSADYWTMEYAALFDALYCIANGVFGEEDFEFALFRMDHGAGEWSVCELWRMHEIMCDQQEIKMFKDFLLASGKPQLVDLWEEMVSHSIDHSSTSRAAYQAVSGKFAQEGLDYEAAWSHIAENP